MEILKKPSFKKGNGSKFTRRLNGVLKKSHELSVLCGTDALVLCFDGSSSALSWPQDQQKCLSMIERYKMYNEAAATKKERAPKKKEKKTKKQIAPTSSATACEDFGPKSINMMQEKDLERVPTLDDQSMGSGFNVSDENRLFLEDHQLLVSGKNQTIDQGYECESSTGAVNFATEGDPFMMNEYSLDDMLLTREEEAYLEGTTSCSGTNYQMLLSNSSPPPMLNDGTNGSAWSKGNSEIDQMFATFPDDIFNSDEILALLND